MMNWYKSYILKFAQIWKYEPSSDDFEYSMNEEDEKVLNINGKIKKFYEMEYKLSMLENKPFKGVPQRKINIINNLKKELNDVSNDILNYLYGIYIKWLDSHALLTPNRWGQSRAKAIEDLESETIYSVLDEYVKWNNDNILPKDYLSSKNKYWNQMTREILANIDKMPSLKDFLQKVEIESLKEMRLSDLYDNGLEEFNQTYGTNFNNDDEASDWINKNTTLQDIDYMYCFESPESFSQSTNNKPSIIAEIYSVIIFPAWYNYWSARGIDDTRENIEKIFDLMQEAMKSNDIKKKNAAISLGLNAVHQTGAMTDYMDDLDKNILTSMTEGSFVTKANEQLKAIGVEI